MRECPSLRFSSQSFKEFFFKNIYEVIDIYTMLRKINSFFKQPLIFELSCQIRQVIYYLVEAKSFQLDIFAKKLLNNVFLCFLHISKKKVLTVVTNGRLAFILFLFFCAFLTTIHLWTNTKISAHRHRCTDYCQGSSITQNRGRYDF